MPDSARESSTGAHGSSSGTDDPGTVEPGAVDPWAEGGAMSTTWTRGHDHAPTPNAAPAAAPAGLRPLSRRGSGVDLPGRHRWSMRRLAVVAAVGLLAAAAGVAVVRQADAPALPTDSTAASDADEADAGEATPQGGTGLPARPAVVAAPAVTDNAPVRNMTTTVIDVAPELADIAPVEVVGLDFQHGLVELSLPSGRLRTTDLGVGSSQAQVAVTDFGSILWPVLSASFLLVGLDGSLHSAQAEPVAWVTSTPGLDRFYVWPSTADPADQPAPRSIDASGAPSGSDPESWLPSDDIIVSIDSAGGFLQRDSGGTYRIDESGSSLLTTGDVVATGRNHVLLRECNERRVCRLVRVDPDGSRTAYPIDLPSDLLPVRVDGLSPVGDALLVIAGRTTPGLEPGLQILDLLDGSVQHVTDALPPRGLATWATDGSGVFVADTLLYYFDRDARSLLVVSDELPKVRSVHSRRPAQSPVCELLTIALTRFDEMRAAPDTAIGPPSTDLLADIVRFAPPELAAAGEPLVTYLGAFVSAEKPESQRIDNWPNEVRASIDTFETYAATTC